MDPPLRERLGWRNSIDSGITVPDSRAAMARAGFWFTAVGTVLALITVPLPGSGHIDTAPLLGAATVAAAMAAVAIAAYDRMPAWGFHAGTLLASVVATAAIYAWGQPSLYGPLPYLWVTVYAFYFFPLRQALAHMAAVGALFAGELSLQDLAFTPVAGWVATMGTLISGGMLVALMRDRLMALISNLTDAARRDALTDLLNRRGFEEAFDIELERARRTGQSLSVIVGDLDRFKLINDRFGHGGGDEALRRVGAELTTNKRSWDSAARIGGEEFAILAPDTDEHGAYILAERVRAAVEQSFRSGGVGPLTISFGIVSYPVHGATAAALLLAGDQALYAAKRLGRNRSVISSAEVPGILSRARGREEGHVELATLLNLAEALDVRDSGSPSHCHRVGRFAELIARELGLAPESVERLRIAGILHDVGRVGMPDDLLTKRGPLTEEDWAWVRAHPQTGARMLETTEFADIGDWILSHHERPDGTGYPEGRRDAPLEAAILGVADAYEAMTARRPYRPPLDPRAAGDELRRGAGRQFDERAVEALLRIV